MFRKLVFTLLIAVLIGTVSVGSVSAGQEKVTVCHKPGTAAEATLEIAAPALNAHLGHGDYEGECAEPQSDGCTALNALVPDPLTGTLQYFLEVSNLEFFPGETLHLDLTITSPYPPDAFAAVGVLDGDGNTLAEQFNSGDQSTTLTASVDYTVVAGDGASGVLVNGFSWSGITLEAVNISCTPAS
ncbi:MAG: hypothetical protein R3C14_45455 [Caldilineaceae bacterium]